MSHILLLGAGFSRNWGGWLADEAFEYLLGHPLIIQNQHLKQLLWKHKDIGGFEYTLAEIQAQHNRGADQQNTLKQLQDAVVQMFADMNKSFLRVNDFDKSLQDFLTKFDAIFTLNQDLLMEGHYHCGNIVQQAASGKTATLILTSTKKWHYWHMPGITNPEVKASVPHKRQYHEGNWFPTDAADFKLHEHKQPTKDIHQSGDFWYFSINNYEDGKSVKTLGSKRKVPIHKTLIQCGLLDYVSQRQKGNETKLFRGKRDFSGWYGKFCDSCGVTDPNVDFHSFRRSFKQACREAEIGEEIHDILTGHTGSNSVGRSYGGISMVKLNELLQRVCYPELDLSHLHTKK